MSLFASTLLASCVALFAPEPVGDAAFYAQQRSYPTGRTTTAQSYYPQGHVLADLDNDGDLDAVIAAVGNFSASKFAVLENAGDGSFLPPTFVSVSGECADVVAADFNTDGFVDLAFCVGGYGTGLDRVAVFRGNGNRTFQPEVSVSCGRGPTGIAAADVDRDGDIDLVTANWYWNESDVSVLRNNGTGGFPGRNDYPIAGTQPYQVAVGDLNGDTWPDLAVSLRGASPAAAILLNNQAGAFGAPSNLPQPAGAGINDVPGIAIADIDNDGDRDVLVAQGGAVGSWGSIGLFRNQGNATFAPLAGYAVDIGSGHDFAIGDITGDGWPDVAVTGHSGNYGYSVLPGDGSGSFATQRGYRAGEWARSVSIGDVDGDGDLDVTVANSGSLTLTVHHNDVGGLVMPPSVPVGAFASGVASGDIDHDGDVDLVTCDTRIWQLFGDGALGFTPSFQNMTGGSRSFCRLVDLNGDGWLDVVAKSSSIQVAFNEGTTFPGFFQPFNNISATLGNANGFDFLDYDLDGDLDLCATVVSGTNRVGIVPRLNATTWGPAFFLSSASVTGGTPIVTGDFDNDGDPDIVYGNGNAVAWRNTGGGTFVGPILTAAAGGFVRMTKGDFDGDGKLDLAGVNYDYNGQGENLVVLRGLGNMSFATPVTYHGMFSIQYGGTTGIDTLDFDRDGDLDIVCAAYGDNDVVLWENNGSGQFASPIGYGVNGVPTAVHVADLDADGWSDVAVLIGTEPPIGGAVAILRGRANSAIPLSYCTAGMSSSGCTPSITASGSASASLSSGFTLFVTDVEGQRQGLVFYGVSGRAAQPWGSSPSFLCVKSPYQRTPAQASGGTPGSCDGGFALDWLAYMNAEPTALGNPVLPGLVVDAQCWYRDPPSPMATNLSDAIEFTVQP